MSNFDFIHVEGFGVRKNGVSKQGNAYDFIPVHITYDPPASSHITGRAAAVVNVDTDDFNRINPRPGEDFTVTLTPSNNFGLRISHWISRGRVDLDLL